MSADDNAPEQAREVEVVAEIVRAHSQHWHSAGAEAWGGDGHCGECGTCWPCDVARLHTALAPLRAAERQEAAREGVAALELTEETDVDWCEYEGWWDPYRDGSGTWAKCTLPADHDEPHEGVDGGSWPRDLQDPADQPKPRRRRLVGPWQDVSRADGVTGRSGT